MWVSSRIGENDDEGLHAIDDVLYGGCCGGGESKDDFADDLVLGVMCHPHRPSSVTAGHDLDATWFRLFLPLAARRAIVLPNRYEVPYYKTVGCTSFIREGNRTARFTMPEAGTRLVAEARPPTTQMSRPQLPSRGSNLAETTEPDADADTTSSIARR
jgi:hypothetical protein